MLKNSKMSGSIRHIRSSRRDDKWKTLCGVHVSQTEWAYMDVDHAFHAQPIDGVTLCPDCTAVVVRVFSRAQT